jgi:hypothetical protein
MQAKGDMPLEWQDTLWEYYRQPTNDPRKGKRVEKMEGGKVLEGFSGLDMGSARE